MEVGGEVVEAYLLKNGGGNAQGPPARTDTRAAGGGSADIGVHRQQGHRGRERGHRSAQAPGEGVRTSVEVGDGAGRHGNGCRGRRRKP